MYFHFSLTMKFSLISLFPTEINLEFSLYVCFKFQLFTDNTHKIRPILSIFNGYSVYQNLVAILIHNHNHNHDEEPGAIRSVISVQLLITVCTKATVNICTLHIFIP
jgi:hypothetical protein